MGLNKFFWFFMSIVVLGIDQLTKYLALSKLKLYKPISIIPHLDFTLAYNTGAAFSFLSWAGSWHRWFFAGFSLIMSAFIVAWICKLPKKNYLELLGLSLILGGALGNLTDRIMHGHVIDFIDLYYDHYHWPIFNFADSAICVGAVLLVYELVFPKKLTSKL